MLTPEQKLELSSGIGASEVGTILGCNPYQTPYELWLIKTGQMEKDLSENEAVIMGNLLEPVIAKRYSQMTQQKVARVNKAYRHKDYPHIMAHIDRKIVGQDTGVEIKTANPFSKEWGEAGTDLIPPMYMAQVQQQMLCTGWKKEDLIVFRGTTDIRIYHFEADEQVHKHIIEKVNHFWFEHILKGIAPPATTRGDLAMIYPKNDGNFIECGQNVHFILDDLEKVKLQAKDLDNQRTKIEKELIEIIASNDGIKIDDEVVATFEATVKGTRVLRIKRRVK